MSERPVFPIPFLQAPYFSGVVAGPRGVVGGRCSHEAKLQSGDLIGEFDLGRENAAKLQVALGLRQT